MPILYKAPGAFVFHCHVCWGALKTEQEEQHGICSACQDKINKVEDPPKKRIARLFSTFRRRA